MKIYFAGSIRGGRNDQELYEGMIKTLSTFGEVLTEHIGDKNLTINGEQSRDFYIHNRDMDWVKEADVIVAEVSTPSLGVGYEIGKADEWGKRILCLYRQTEEGKRLSAMIGGNGRLEIKTYSSLDDIKGIFENFFETSIKRE